MGFFGEEKTYPLDEADYLIKMSKGKERSKYDLFDVILYLLFADHKYAIHGKTRLMKEIFLTYQEVLQEHEERQKIPQIVFTKYKYGPYNEDIEYILDDMAFANYLEVDGKGNSASIRITSKGQHYIEQRFFKLPERIQEALKLGRKSWDTNPDLLNYVYTHYSDYLENSVLKKRYRPIDWESAFEDKK